MNASIAQWQFADEEAMLTWAAKLGPACYEGACIYLHGNLGMGKTTLSRGVLRGLGYQGAVKSPTYTLVEPYQLAELALYHFDLYRLGDPEELEFMGIRDYFDGHALCLVEWPEKGGALLPTADLDIWLTPWQQGRELKAQANTARGLSILKALGCE
ncbi:tRNA (adenosine(37)-N6)-threonylcarbamoyltransferase complex ATPase subunit type 1 TsaE [Balneatrix alpica]|uniref:tRNA threonylcarbamoyladenosine biosynthesis protein TsaE n=1 Tax=Balneatrix alpica TaxID=75684 RepID=A0ABV5ZEG3_9GAMM|nr:tRNA (adenosine(37)-N6)-threonylcarbamoyltransferase complex ATPase subunit type 1 TsaE [Balneatrix alpica]